MKKNFSPLVTRYYFLDEIFSNQVSPMKIISSTNNWIVFTRLINKEKKLLLLSINITLGSLIKKKPQNRKIISITSQIFDLESNYIIKLSYFSTVRINREFVEKNINEEICILLKLTNFSFPKFGEKRIQKA